MIINVNHVAVNSNRSKHCLSQSNFLIEMCYIISDIKAKIIFISAVVFTAHTQLVERLECGRVFYICSAHAQCSYFDKHFTTPSLKRTMKSLSVVHVARIAIFFVHRPIYFLRMFGESQSLRRTLLGSQVYDPSFSPL